MRTFLVVGGTGAMGGSVVRRLLATSEATPDATTDAGAANAGATPNAGAANAGATANAGAANTAAGATANAGADAAVGATDDADTGASAGALADVTVSVLTRDPLSARAVALGDLGDGRVRLVQGDLDDPESLEAALHGVDSVFANTDFFATGSVLGEYGQGVALLEAARAAGVDRFIWSSLDSAAMLTGGGNPVPHYDAKAAVAAHINLMRSHEMMSQEADGWYTDHVSILTTAPYFENLPHSLPPQAGVLADGREGLNFALALGEGRWPLIGLDDIAWFAGFMFEHWQDFGTRDLAVVGDNPTGAEIAATFERVTGTASAYVPVPLDALRDAIPGVGHDFAAMFRFFQERDLFTQDRDIIALRALHPALMTFEDWLRSTGWDGTSPA